MKNIRLAVCLAGWPLLLQPPAAPAQTSFWVNAGNTNWSTATAWSNATPVAGGGTNYVNAGTVNFLAGYNAFGALYVRGGTELTEYEG